MRALLVRALTSVGLSSAAFDGNGAFGAVYQPSPALLDAPSATVPCSRHEISKESRDELEKRTERN
jgi:hypothetical protein